MSTLDSDYLFLEGEKKRRPDNKRSEIGVLAKRHAAIERYEGHDDDKDFLDDGAEIQSSLHNLRNEPLHKPLNRLGPSTPGKAFVSSSNGQIQWGYDNSRIDLRVKPIHAMKNGVHTMKSPKPFKLSINLASKVDHITSGKGFSIDLNVNPQNYRMGNGKINGGVKNLKISSVLENINRVADGHHKKMDTFSKKYSAEYSVGRKERKRDHKEINDLGRRLAGFVHQTSQKKKSSEIIGASSLDFSIVGINPKKKKVNQ